MKKQAKYLLAFIICLFQCFSISLLNAQQPGGIFYHLTSKNGLSSDRVNAVIQDREGFYWIATQDGLNRFDGSSCKIFRNKKNDSASLSHNNCIHLLEDDIGDIWIATPQGVNRYLKKENRFERFYLSNPSALFERVNYIRGMVKGGEGNIWIASSGLWQYNIYSGKWTSYLNDPNDPTSIPAGLIFGIEYDRINNGLWISSSGLMFFDIGEKKFYHTGNLGKKIFPFERINVGNFVLDSANSIWFIDSASTLLSNYSIRNKTIRAFPLKINSGVYRFSIDAENRLWINYWYKSTRIFDPVMNRIDTGFLQHYHQQSPLTDIATNLYIDKTGNYWICSSKGINIYNPRAQAVKYFWLNDERKTDQGLNNAITCLAEQNDNIVWVGTKAGLFRYDLVEKKYKIIKGLPLSSTYIRCLYMSHDSILWIGVWNMLLLFDPRTEKVLKKIPLLADPQFITADNKGNTWIGTWYDGLLKFSASGQMEDKLVAGPDKSKTILYNGLTCFEKNEGQPILWIGYNGGYGFGKLNYSDHSAEHFMIPSNQPYLNPVNTVNCITKDGWENLWLGTYGGGLVYFDRQKKSFTGYTQSDGLKGDYINTVLLDSNSNIWVTTSNGLSVIDARTNSIINSEIDLRFDDNDFVSNGIHRRNNKLLYFSGLKIVEIDPASFLQTTYPSRILLSSFKIFEKETSLENEKGDQPGIHLSYRQNFFSFEYSLLKPNPETPTLYAYKLEGFDKDWNNVRERRTAYYTNVPPGDYKFKVKATDESGKWVYFSEPVVIVISPPFWKAWWFWFLTGLLITVSALYIVHDRIKQLKKRQKEQLRLIVATQEQEKKNISAELHDDLGVRLSALKYFVASLKDHLQPDNPLAKETYNKTMGVIDESVEDIRYLLVNLSPKTLNEYGYLIAVEDLVNKLGRLHIIDIDLKQKGIEQRLPADMEAGLYRITQELINNTLKHALAKNIHLNIERANGFIRLQYEDNGKGFYPSLHGEGYGMQNIHTRVALLNGKIEWDTGKEKSTRVTITVPYNHT